jgi:hypothetical protein
LCFERTAQRPIPNQDTDTLRHVLDRIEEKFLASPALVKGRMYLRSFNNLYCLAGDAAKPAGP